MRTKLRPFSCCILLNVEIINKSYILAYKFLNIICKSHKALLIYNTQWCFYINQEDTYRYQIQLMSFLLQFVQYCIKNGSKLTLLWRTLRRCSIRKLSSICDIFYLRNMNVQDNNIMHVEYHNTIYNNHLQARSIYCTWPICFSLTLRNISHILFLFSHPPPRPNPQLSPPGRAIF